MQSRRHPGDRNRSATAGCRKGPLSEAVSKSLNSMSEQVRSTQLTQMFKDDKQALMSIVHAETNSTHELRQELQHMMEKNHLLVIENCRLRALMRTQA